MHVFSENLKLFKEKTVKVSVEHKIYGSQQLKIRSFQPLLTEDKIGFVVEGREIFLYIDEIENIKFNKNMLQIIGGIQTITIKDI